MTVSIVPPKAVYFDVDGTPLEAGYIYIGERNRDAEQYPVSVYWDMAQTLPAVQPLRTIGGYPARDGLPSAVYTESAYSITVKDKFARLVYSAEAELTSVPTSDIEVLSDIDAEIAALSLIIPEIETISANIANISSLANGILPIYDDRAAMLASTETARGEGEVWVAKGLPYVEASSSATDHHLTTTGGAKLYRTEQSRETYYIDSVRGSDSNDGLTPETAFATIGAMHTAAVSNLSYVTVMLARGSTFFEQLGDEDKDEIHAKVIGYGSGRLPIIDCRDTVATGSMSKTAGQTNVYQFNWTPTDGNDVGPSLWESGSRMARASSIANCDSTPGSYYASSSYSDGVAAAVYFHPTASNNPTSSGTIYKQAVRQYSIYLGRYSDIRNVHAGWQQSNNGAVYQGRHSYAQNVLTEDGSKHNHFIASGVLEDCIAWKADLTWTAFGATTSIPFIAYNVSDDKDPIRFDRCKVVMPETHADGTAIGAFYAHGISGNVAYQEMQVIDCETYYSAVSVVGCAQTQSLEIDGMFSYNCGRLIGNTLSMEDDTLTCRRSEWYLDDDSSDWRGFWRPQSSSSVTLVIEDFIAIVVGDEAAQVTGAAFRSIATGSTNNVTLKRGLIIADADGAGGAIGYAKSGVEGNNGGDSWTIENVLFHGWGEGSQSYSLEIDSNAAGYSGDYNVYMGYNGSADRGRITYPDYAPSYYNNASDYLTAVDGTAADEPNSVSTTTTQFTGKPFLRQYDLIEGGDAETNGCRPRFTPKYKDKPPKQIYQDLWAKLEAM